MLECCLNRICRLSQFDPSLKRRASTGSTRPTMLTLLLRSLPSFYFCNLLLVSSASVGRVASPALGLRSPPTPPSFSFLSLSQKSCLSSPRPSVATCSPYLAYLAGSSVALRLRRLVLLQAQAQLKLGTGSPRRLPRPRLAPLPWHPPLHHLPSSPPAVGPSCPPSASRPAHASLRIDSVR